MPYSLRIFARQTLQKWEDKDKLRISTQNAKNDLESYIFSLKEKLYEETVIEMSTEKEREVLSERVSEASQWLENEGESNILEEYKKQKTALENHAKDIFHRIKEATARPEAIINCLASINITKELLPAISEKHQVTPEEVLSLYKTCMEVEEWLKNKFEEQEKLEKFENPVLTSSMVEQKCSIISLQLKFFSKRALRPKEKKETTKTTKTTKDEKTDTKAPNQEENDKTEQPSDQTDHDHQHSHDHDHQHSHDHDHQHSHDHDTTEQTKDKDTKTDQHNDHNHEDL